MNKEIKSIVKKTTKIAGITCFVLGGAALIASGAAVKALAEGGKYLKDTVRKIVNEETKTEEVVVDAVTEEAPAEAVEAVAADEAVCE